MNQLIGCCGLDCETCDAPDASADVPPVLTLPILDEIEQNVTIGTAGSSLLAVQEAAKLLDWARTPDLVRMRSARLPPHGWLQRTMT